MRVVLLAFAAGMWWLQRQPCLPSHPAVWLPFGLLATAFGGVALLRSTRAGRPAATRWLAVLATAFAAAVTGFHWAALRADLRLAEVLPEAWEGRDITVEGVIDDLPIRSDQGWRFVLATSGAPDTQAPTPHRLSLAWYALRRNADGADALPDLRAGERWRLTVRLRRPHGNVNPGGFDLEAWLLEHGIRATGYVSASRPQRQLAAFAGRPIDYVNRARDMLRAKIESTLGDRPYVGVIVALAIGEQRAIPADQWQLFTRTGIGHLLAISGMHVTLFATLVGALALAIWRRLPWLALRVPAARAAILIGVVASASYVLLAGAQVPAQRTLYMLAVAAFALWFGVPSRASSVLLIALVVVLAVDPWAVQAAGFWLSFGAVAMILAASTGRIGALSAWRTAVRAQVAVTIGLLPVTLLLFQQVSVVSPLANAAAIPVVSFVVVPLTLAGLALPNALPLELAHATFALLASALAPLATLPAAVWAQHAPAGAAVALATVGVAAAMLPRGVPGRWASALWFVPLFLWRPPPPAPGEFHMAVLDVGQGLAAVVRTHRHALAYDAGPRFNETADAGNRIVVPYLRNSGIRRLDLLVISHDDVDHSGGAASVMAAVEVARMVGAIAPDSAALRLHARQGRFSRPCVAGERWSWDGVVFEFLHPPAGSVDAPARRNDSSCVLRIESARGSALIAGDIEARTERRLLAAQRERLAADVLVVPHHGSRTSSTPEFVAAVRPGEAIFATGHRNRFGHPVPEVEERYRRGGARLWRTDRDGALLLRVGPTRVVDPQRAAAPRYWRHAGASVCSGR